MNRRKIFYSVVLGLLISFFLSILYLFKPYSFIDHSKSRVVCQKNNVTYDLGPNLILVLDKNLDKSTDKNVRKLCEYAIINDYQDAFKTPPGINYQPAFAYEKAGSWGDAVLIGTITFLLIISIVDWLSKLIISNFQFLANEPDHRSVHGPVPSRSIGTGTWVSNLISIILGLLIFFTFLQKPVRHIYCERQIASKIHNFEKSAYGYGLQHVQEEEKRMSPAIKESLEQCLKTNNWFNL